MKKIPEIPIDKVVLLNIRRCYNANKRRMTSISGPMYMKWFVNIGKSIRAMLNKLIMYLELPMA